MLSAILLAVGTATAFFLGIFFKKAQDNSQILKKISQYNKELEKINSLEDLRSDEDVLKKKG